MTLTAHERQVLAAIEQAIVKNDPLFAIRIAKLTPGARSAAQQRPAWIRQLFHRGPGD